MLKISTNNSPTNNFKQQQFDISKRRTLVNAVDTLDLEINQCNKEFNSLQKTSLVCFSAIFAFIIAKFGENLDGNKLYKLTGSKMFSLMLGVTALSMLLFGLLNKKRADGMYKTN